MNHEACRQEAGGRDDGLARRQPFGVERAPNLTALFEYARAAGAVNRPVNAAAAHQGAVGRVDDRLRSMTGDVAHGDADSPREEDGLSLLLQRSIHEPQKDTRGKGLRQPAEGRPGAPAEESGLFLRHRAQFHAGSAGISARLERGARIEEAAKLKVELKRKD